jgi:hypothetical protein
MARKGNEFDQEMAQLEAEIKRLEVEYNMFFAGRLPRLPWETRARVEKLVKHYDRMHIPNTAQRFRFGTVQARFMAFCELWERNLKAREEGRAQRGAPSAAAPVATPSPAPAEPAPADPARPAAAPAPPPVAQAPPPSPPARVASPPQRPAVASTAAIKDPTRESDRLKQLYDRLSQARHEAGEPPLAYNNFANVIKAQVSKLGGGTKAVEFRVDVKDGKVTLTAKTGKG